MSAKDRRRGKQSRRPGRSRNQGQRRLLPLALTGAVGVIVILAVLGVRFLTGGEETEEPSEVSSSPLPTVSTPPPTGFQRIGPLEVSATEVDLGSVPLGEWVTPTFQLRNVSTGPVTVTIRREGVETLEGC